MRGSSGNERATDLKPGASRVSLSATLRSAGRTFVSAGRTFILRGRYEPPERGPLQRLSATNPSI